MTSTLIGIAVDQDLLSLDQPVLAFFPDLAPPTTGSDPKDAIEMRHLLTMSSGLDCGRAPGEPELYQMLGSEHFVKYALELPMAAEPGEYFAYCSPGSHLLSAMLAEAADTSTGAFAAEHLFGPLGIEEFVWPTDPQGIERGWGDLQLFPRDMARIGHLVANGGLWNGVQVVSKSWLEQATRSWIPAEVDGAGYGYQWWILAGAFDGLYEARGRGGQAIIIWPDKDIVVVFTGRGVDVRGEIALLLADALKSDEAIEPNPAAEARLQAALAQATLPPAPGPIPVLPPAAAEVSGNVYQLEPNQFGTHCASLRFASESEVTFVLSVDEGTFDLPVGMDGVPRFSESGPTGMPVGVTGEWSSPRVFALRYDEVAGPNHLRIEADFGDDVATVTLWFTDPGDAFPPQLVAGSLTSSCE